MALIICSVDCNALTQTYFAPSAVTDISGKIKKEPSRIIVRIIVCVRERERERVRILQISMRSLKHKIIPTESARNPASAQNTPKI
jgi:hypothetical protein